MAGAIAFAAGGGQALAAIDTANADRCDFLDTAHCLYPWPNDYFTVPDGSKATGRRVNLNVLSMPRNIAGRPIDPTEWNRNDGFSPGALIITRVPGLDNPTAFGRTGAVPITDIRRSFSKAQPIVLINARTRRRQAIWAELDAHASDPAHTDLLIHPAVNLAEGNRYIVALRNLKDARGRALRPSAAFRVYRDRIATSQPEVERRRPHMESLFRTLKRAGIARSSLYLTWDFTVASGRNLAERMLHLRDDAFAQLGERTLGDLRVQGTAPRFVVDPRATMDFKPCGSDGCQSGESDQVARHVEGRFFVPCYLNQPGCPSGSQFLYSSPTSTIPQRLPGNVAAANFICNIPRWVVERSSVRPARPFIYGHGLLGSADEVNSKKLYDLDEDHGFVSCATDWIGMAEEDLPNAATILTDLSRFPTLADRVQQGMLNFLYLGRLMIHPQGFSANPAFRFTRGGRSTSAIDTRRLYYDGGSQGGIIGGALTAVAPDFTNAALGVPGMNYSILLDRSVDFDQYAQILYRSYPDQVQRPLLLSLVQMLWDRAEANGYAQHMTTRTYPNTPRHAVLLDMAFGDHQVTNWATMVEARTIGARIRQPALERGRSPERRPFYGIKKITRFPFSGSAIFVWDVGPLRLVGGRIKGTPPPPTTNTPNRQGVDPHGPDASETKQGQAQIAAFLAPRGRIINPCGRRPCYLDGYTGRR